MSAHGFTASDGVQIAYLVDDFIDPWRPAKTVVMLHSAMGSARRFYSMVPAIARHYRVVRMDLRGHGQSAVPPAEPALTMARLVDDVRELFAHLGLARAHIVGNSAGGYLAQHIAMYHGHLADSIMLFGSTPGLKHSQARTWLPRVAREGLRAFLADTIADRFDVNSTDPGLISWFLDECARNDTDYIGRFIGLMTTLDWSNELHRIKCPVLCVYPGGETVGSIRSYDVMAERIADIEMLGYDHMPHNIFDAAPERCAADVLRFLEKRFGDGAGPQVRMPS
ncbi:MAG: alpha/beta hydrolase [Alphaproteobacteria bacterium]|nr:alpha/beta hydrolase [Alphaproteobacteria bacterium]